MNLKAPLEKSGLKSVLKGKTTKWWMLLFMALITSMSVVCGTVCVVYTIGEYSLNREHLKLEGEQLRSMEESRKLVEKQVNMEEANENTKKRASVYVNIVEQHYDNKSRNTTYATFLSLHQSIGSQFQQLMDDHKQRYWYIWVKDAQVGLKQTPAELGVTAGETIKIVVP